MDINTLMHKWDLSQIHWYKAEPWRQIRYSVILSDFSLGYITPGISATRGGRSGESV